MKATIQALLLIAGLSLGGCSLWRVYGEPVQGVSTERLSAGGERVELPFDVPTAAAAFAEALPAAGYSLSLREVSAARATLVGEANGRRAKVHIKAVEAGSQAVVSVGPLADAAACAQLIEAAKSRLGVR